MKKILGLITVFVFILGLSACKETEYVNITNEELETFLDSDEDYLFIDVRTSSEYYGERIPGFTYNIDYYLLDQDEERSDLTDLNRTTPVVIMCNSGNRSASAALIFIEAGFETVYNLENGIQGWNGETE
jgi:rhodanese-related sulfurtransferase